MMYDVGVIGLGYVGLTLSTALAEVGQKVIGIEKRADVVDLTNAGKPHFSETGLEDALTKVTQRGTMVARENFDPGESCRCYIITVGTPLGPDGKARLDMIQQASRQVAENMPDDALVILRSTVKIGTARDVVGPILAASGKAYALAMCPERTLEGRAMQELRELPQIVGGDDEDTRRRAGSLFRRLTNTIVDVSSLEAAEIVKLVDNTYRDVSFAFANEVARVCEVFDVNAMEVIGSGKLGYKRTNVPLPGLVGGPCLEKDPHILRQSALDRGIDLEITQSSRMVNERQPEETVAFIAAEMDRRGMAPDTPVALLGMAFKGIPATDDLRGSMSLKVLAALRAARPDAPIRLYDPVIEPDVLGTEVPGHTVAESLEAAVENAGVAVIANNHPDLGRLPPAMLADHMPGASFVYDYWNHFSKLSADELGGHYFAVGRTKG